MGKARLVMEERAEAPLFEYIAMVTMKFYVVCWCRLSLVVAHTGGQPVPAAFYLSVPSLVGAVQHALC